MEYYYLRNIDKAIYYHNRMMEGEHEKQTPAKECDLEQLERARRGRAFKSDLAYRTVFEAFHDWKFSADPAVAGADFRYPHEDRTELAKLEGSSNRILAKKLLLSPKYQGANIKEGMLKQALHTVLLSNLVKESKELDALEELNKSVEEEDTPENSASWEHQFHIEQQKKLLYSDSRVVSLANRYHPL